MIFAKYFETHFGESSSVARMRREREKRVIKGEEKEEEQNRDKGKM